MFCQGEVNQVGELRHTIAAHPLHHVTDERIPLRRARSEHFGKVNTAMRTDVRNAVLELLGVIQMGHIPHLCTCVMAALRDRTIQRGYNLQHLFIRFDTAEQEQHMPMCLFDLSIGIDVKLMQRMKKQKENAEQELSGERSGNSYLSRLLYEKEEEFAKEKLRQLKRSLGSVNISASGERLK